MNGLVLEGTAFPDKEITNTLGFKGIQDGSGTDIACKMLDYSKYLLMKDDDETNAYIADFAFDMMAGKQLISEYKDIIEYQFVGNTKATQIRVVYSKQRLKTGCLCTIEPTQWIVSYLIRIQKTNTEKLSVYSF